MEYDKPGGYRMNSVAKMQNSVAKRNSRSNFAVVNRNFSCSDNPTLESPWENLREVLRIMRNNQLLAKLKKFSFAKTKVEYLGHIFSEKGLQTDPAKRFIKSYGTISKPLTNMLKKDAFQWSVESETAFERLKEALCTTLVLTLPDFDKEFVVEADDATRGWRLC
ncbi:PREDICTED: uncharacterized protein LOC109146927 [Ipomoea nil]|uniref:uncharacterized protein LOC109146927 n=1 Tax=Ipomoea nil TaxID=35883 RepID=UPI0009013C61|nr:PREDICTED: uncharacterized protein LOC109146927 [Ipomoea nil]